jgi:hypothetical protein
MSNSATNRSIVAAPRSIGAILVLGAALPVVVMLVLSPPPPARPDPSLFGVESYSDLAKRLDVTPFALASLLEVLRRAETPPEDLPGRLRAVAGRYRALLAAVQGLRARDPAIQQDLIKAGQALRVGDWEEAERRLTRAADKHLRNARAFPRFARTYRREAAQLASLAADLKRVELDDAQGADYDAKAAALLPRGRDGERRGEGTDGDPGSRVGEGESGSGPD